MNKAARLLLGMIAGNIVGAALCAIATGLEKLLGNNNTGIWLVYPSLFFIPFTIGIVAAWIWKPLDLRIGPTILHATLCSLIVPMGAALVFHEGIICLLIGF